MPSDIVEIIIGTLATDARNVKQASVLQVSLVERCANLSGGKGEMSALGSSRRLRTGFVYNCIGNVGLQRSSRWKQIETSRFFTRITSQLDCPGLQAAT
jgi:hypothetical protein